MTIIGSAPPCHDFQSQQMAAGVNHRRTRPMRVIPPTDAEIVPQSGKSVSLRIDETFRMQVQDPETRQTQDFDLDSLAARVLFETLQGLQRAGRARRVGDDSPPTKSPLQQSTQ